MGVFATLCACISDAASRLDCCLHTLLACALDSLQVLLHHTAADQSNKPSQGKNSRHGDQHSGLRLHASRVEAPKATTCPIRQPGALKEEIEELVSCEAIDEQ